MPDSLCTDRLGAYIFENMEDGVILLTRSGAVSYINSSAKKMLRASNEDPTELFIRSRLCPDDARNDAFFQLILDAVYQKDRPVSKRITFYPKDASPTVMQVRSSYWNDPNDPEANGVLLIMQDVTEEERLKQEKSEAIYTFSLFLICIGIWSLFYAATEHFGIEIPRFVMTYILLGLGIGISAVLHFNTSLKVSAMGISLRNIKKPLMFNLLVSAAACVLLILAKFIAVRCGIDHFPEDQPFWDFGFTLGMKLYPLSVFLQEFISQSILHECLMRILSGKHSHIAAIFLSAVLFTVLHIHRGFGYMLGSLFLVCIIGALYRKQRNIWGICLTHYTVSMTAFFLNWV